MSILIFISHPLHVDLSIQYIYNIANFKGFNALFNPNFPYFDLALVYLLECSNDTYYAGITHRLEHRLAAHNSGHGARYTRARRPQSSSWLPKSTQTDLKHPRLR
ncbi:GIY-YIG nuclease family protein [Polynucleobacter necessarius]|uniref:GIY-YIG nuclease family protein n=1 Tax=Polynucleobacter necessarius TaxID=576610 RepID=UPI001E5C8427|nr:GIY-YIG nuclease family protein [Polynucleobacter necessarius]